MQHRVKHAINTHIFSEFNFINALKHTHRKGLVNQQSRLCLLLILTDMLMWEISISYQTKI